MQRIFLLALAFVVTLGAALGAFLFASLWPYFSLIGKVAAGVVIVGLVCTSLLMVAFTYNRVCMWNNRRRLVIAGEVVAYLAHDGTFIHLSAQHEAAKVIPQVTVKEIAAPKPVADKETVLELFNTGTSLRNIADITGLTYYQVQQITSGKK